MAYGEMGHTGLSERAFLLLGLSILLKVIHFHGNKAKISQSQIRLVKNTVYNKFLFDGNVFYIVVINNAVMLIVPTCSG